MDYNNIILLAHERHAELIKNAEVNSRRIGTGHVIVVPNIFDRAVTALKAVFAKPVSTQPRVSVAGKLAAK